MEGDVRVDDRPLAGVALHLLEHVGRHRQGLRLGQLLRAGLRMAVPLHVQHRRQGGRIVGDVLLEPVHLLLGRAAPEHEVVGTARHARLAGRVPVGAEAVVDMVAALRRLDEGELGAGGADRGPVDVALPLRDVDPLDRMALGARDARMGLGVAVRRVEVVVGRAGREARQERRREDALAQGAQAGGLHGTIHRTSIPQRHRCPARHLVKRYNRAIRWPRRG